MCTTDKFVKNNISSPKRCENTITINNTCALLSYYINPTNIPVDI